MARFIRKGYLKLKCSECHKQHSFEGRDLVFDPYGKKEIEGKIEMKYLCSLDFFCGCDTKVHAEIMITEYPEGKLYDVTYEGKNSEILEKVNISII